MRRCSYCGRALALGHLGPLFCPVRRADTKRARDREARRRRYAADPEKHREASRRHRAANPDKVREQGARWRAANPERARAATRRWEEANPARLREARRRWKVEHAEANRQHARKWAARNPDRNRERARQWAKEHPERVRAIQNARRARKRDAPGAYTVQEWRSRCAESGGRCFYCGVAGRLTVDHVQPLAAGGANTIANIVPACPTCNSSKGDGDPGTWLTRRVREGRPVTARALALLSTPAVPVSA